MTNIVATGISSKLTAAEKQAVRTNIDVEKGIRDYQAYIDSLFAKATLDLNFVTNEHKVYEAFGPTNKLITDAITTARNSTATYQGPMSIASAAINTPRIAYDSATGSPLGLLIEETRTNLLLRSEEFDNASWVKQAGATITPNTTIAPDGTSYADTLTTNNGISVNQSANTSNGVVHCQSVHVKAGTITRLMIRDDTGAGRHIVIDPATGVVTSTSGTLVAHGVERLPNGWLRPWFSYTADTNVVRMNIRSDAENAATVVLWGAQIEVGSLPSAYIPTAGAQMQRFVDQFNRTLTANNQGTLLCLSSGGIPTVGLNQAAFALTDGTSNNRVVLRRNNATGGTQYLVISGGVNVAQVNTTQKPAGQFNAFGMSWRQDRFLASEDGINVMEDLAGATPVNLTQLGIGSSGPAFAGAEALNGTIKRLVYIPQSLNKTEIDALTAYLKAQG